MRSTISHREVGEQAEEAERDEVDQRQQRARGARRQQVRQQHDGDMGIAARHHGAADERHAHQAVAGDLLGPGQAVVEDVAGEELQEDDEGERPEQRKRQPVLGVMLDLDFRVLDVDQMLLRLRPACSADIQSPDSRLSRSPCLRAAPSNCLARMRSGRTAIAPHPDRLALTSPPAARRIRPGSSRHCHRCAAAAPRRGMPRGRPRPRSCRAS